jgi:hypothetical protein
MRLKLPITFVLLMLCASWASANSFLSFEDHILTSFSGSIEAINKAGIKGPIAEEVARWALIRQLHENGLNRGHTYCIPGISCGGWNRETLNWCLRYVTNEVGVSRIADSEGMLMYELNGRGANIVSTAAVALLFDYYVKHFNWFSTKEKEDWEESRKYSDLIAQGFDFPQYRKQFHLLKDARQKILRKCSGGYGPGNERISSEVKKQSDLFETTIKLNR